MLDAWKAEDEKIGKITDLAVDEGCGDSWDGARMIDVRGGYDIEGRGARLFARWLFSFLFPQLR